MTNCESQIADTARRRWWKVTLPVIILAISVLNLLGALSRSNEQARHTDVLELFTSIPVHIESGPCHGITANIRLYQPKNLSRKREYPLLIWANGFDDRTKLMHLRPAFWKQGHLKCPGLYILAMPFEALPSCRSEDGHEPADGLLWAVVSELTSRYQLDENRIYLSGFSLGGAICWDLVQRHPDRFAAVVPIASGAPKPTADLVELAEVPIWAFQPAHDPTGSPARLREMVENVQKSGGSIALTELDLASHNCWIPVFEDYRIIDWMQSHSRQKRGYQPGSKPHRFGKYQPLILVALVGACIVAPVVLYLKRGSRWV